MSIVLTPITLKLADSLHRCLDAVARERRHIALLEAPPLYHLRAYVLENLHSQNPHFVALDGDQVIGWCDIVRESLPSLAHAGVLGMGVAAEYRRQGLGQNLLNAALEQARAVGIERVELNVFASNMPAMGLYQKNGFLPEGCQHHKVCIDGQYQDMLQMARWLR